MSEQNAGTPSGQHPGVPPYGQQPGPQAPPYGPPLGAPPYGQQPGPQAPPYGPQTGPYHVPPGISGQIWGMNPNTYCMLLHLSQLVFGILGPILLWAVNKDQHPIVDMHGKAAMNWCFSVLIYMFGSLILCLILIGIIPLIASVVCFYIFPIIAGVKANNGEVWKYPLSIPFFKIGV